MKSLSLGRFFALVGRVRRKPLRVIVHRTWQVAKLLAHHHLRIWRRYERLAERRWSEQVVREFASRASTGGLVSGDGVAAVAEFFRAHPDEQAALGKTCDDVAGGRVSVFGATVELPPWDSVNWRVDWRFNYEWHDAFYRQYNFYEFDKSIPYDVKFPWELSRLQFLLVPTLFAVAGDKHEWLDHLTRILESWRKGNPYARTVNWYPMECAMRGVNLALLAMLLVHHKSADTASLRTVLVLCEMHGRFLYRTVEYSDVRGNHFAAEIAALVLLGLLLRDDHAEAGRWLEYGRRFLEGELFEQFSCDGVQFEKSTSYHRLVTELFLLASLALERAGLGVSTAAKQRLRSACRYSRSYLGPDGLAPIWGDSDDASVIQFAPRDHRDHRPLTAFAAAYFQDASLQFPGCQAFETPLFFGTQLAEEASPARCGPPAKPTRHFESGGMICATFGDHHFLADVGQVGLKGRGGHGHLDALSFELTLFGVRLVVDPGSYVYTGDPAARNDFRRSRAHNVVIVDGQETASFFPDQLWRLGSEADPFDVEWQEDERSFVLLARHNGYCGLSDPVHYQRRWEFAADQGCLHVQDTFDCKDVHHVERWLHFDDDLQCVLDGNRLLATSPNGRRFAVTWEDNAKAILVDDWISRSYGNRTASKTLQLASDVRGTTQLGLTISGVANRDAAPRHR